MDDDILEQYRIEAAAAMKIEAKKRIEGLLMPKKRKSIAKLHYSKSMI